VAAFILSLALGISVRGQIFVVLLRALGFGLAFFILAAIIWNVINKFIPELLQAPSPQDASLMVGLDNNGSRVDITVGDREDAVPQDAVLPPEEDTDDSVGNISEVMSGGYASRSVPAPRPAAGDSPSAAPPAAADPIGYLDGSLDPSPLESLAPAEGMDQSPQSGYTQGGSSPVGASGLGNLSGDIESLPDLDAMAGTFLSPDAAAGEETGPSPYNLGASVEKAPRAKKGNDMGEDFNPKELASAIQTILKRD
jgi:hypothetical protein